MKLDFRKRLLATTLLVGTGLLATPAFAQEGGNQPEPPDTSAVPTTPATVGPVEGQGVPSTNAQGAPVTAPSEIIVTGSRIPQPNLQTASPVTTVTSQEVKLSGTTRTEDLVNSLPQVFADQGSNISNGATGTAAINLRGLGAKRTMVLINGRRLVGGDPRVPVPDINFIPLQLVKRVDVLTGGASAVYGADAVAGVVNFIMDDTFTGLRLDGQASVFNHHNHMGGDIVRANTTTQTDVFGVPAYRYPTGMSTNGGSQDIAGVFGAAFDDGRGHVQAYATYRHQDPVLEATRDFSFCALGAFAPQYVAAYGEYYCGGSSTSDTGSFRTFTPGGAALKAYHVEGEAFVPGTTLFNYAPYNYFQRPDERYTLGAFANYEISPAFKPYLEVMFMNDHTDALIAPSGDFSNTNRINCDNPLLTPDQLSKVCTSPVYNAADANPTFNSKGQPVYKSYFGNLVGATPIFDPNGPVLCSDPADPTTCNPIGILGFNTPTLFPNGTGGTFTQGIMTIGRRNVEGGGRDDDLEHTNWRIVAGMRGDVARGISYDVSYQYDKSLLSETYYNDFSLTKLTRALDVVAVKDGVIVAPGTEGATIQCRSVANGTDSACVPYNVFATGGVTPDALAYVQTPGFQRGNVALTIAQANMTFTGADYGLQTPWADTGIGANIGVDYVKNSLSFSPDIEFQTGDLTGQGSTTPPVAGHTDVREIFGELQVPIVEHNFIDLLQFSTGYRLSNYHIGGDSFNTSTYKLDGEFAPIADVRFRGSYNRAVRAPNVSELFSPQAIGLVGTEDPCEGTAPTATLEQCVATGISASQYGAIPENPAHQYTGFLGGNPNLVPEKADTYTFGVILQPRFIPGLALSVDHFNIKVKGLISTLGFSTVMNECITEGLFCDLINRDQFGTLWLTPQGFITLLNTNVGGLQTKGFDFNGSYNRRLGGIGTLNLSFVGTYLKRLITNPFGDIFYDCAGYYGNTCGTPNPKWRHKARVSLTMPNGIGASIQWRHFSGVQFDALSSNPVLNDPEFAPGNNHYTKRDYFDLSFTARMAQKLNLRLGVNNIFDKDPPLNGAALGNGNTYPQVYDALGRYMFAGFTVDF
ncbi:TonB-dependent receptor domain-containing protein [Sphingomonas segetis]|uniref:TonB-dependent receptor domain-containing protein n=1 Tax=Sphingomonas segetis TaxID=1104779 RepID=UPI0012D317C2|nr:TonB-dependent receptor [Sphingomonas segetis]